MWLLHPPKSRRRWHLFTWLAALPALVFVALVQVAGVQEDLRDRDPQLLKRTRFDSSVRGSVDAHAPPPPYRVEEHVHGWPMTWLRRAQGFGDPPWRDVELVLKGNSINVKSDEALHLSGHPISWSARKAWPGDCDRQRFYPLGLLVNLIVSGLLFAIPMAAVETWLRRRGGLWRFKIIDFLACTLVIASGFGFYRWDQAEHGWELEVLGGKSGWGLQRVEMDYVGPEWVARLVGNRQAVPVLRRSRVLVLHDFEQRKEYLARLADFRYLRRIRLSNETGDISIMVALEQFEKIEQIEIRSFLNDDFRLCIKALPKFPRLKAVVLKWGLLPEDLAPLQRCSNLETLAFDPTYISPDELAQLRNQFPRVRLRLLDLLPPVPNTHEVVALKRLNRRLASSCQLNDDATVLCWHSAPFSAVHVAPLARVVPQIRNLILVDADFPAGQWPDLTQFTSLVDLTLDVRELPLEFMEQVAKLPQLNSIRVHRRPLDLEPLLLLRHNPPDTFYLGCVLNEKETALVREAFGDRLRLSVDGPPP